LNQRPTQTLDFWQSKYQVTDEAIEALYNNFLESGEPASIDEVGLFFVQQALEAEERAIRSELQQGEVYQTDQSYEVGDKLIFPNFDYVLGTVIESRAGYNPSDGDFSVLEVEFDTPGKPTLQFAADLKSHHVLSSTYEKEASDNGGVSEVQKIYGLRQHTIRPKVEKALQKNSEFVTCDDQHFLVDLLVDVPEGLLNIVDAAIDINAGPLNVDALIEQLELQKNGKITDATRFSVNHRLEHDPRFLNVGTDHRALWYLERLKPTQVIDPPHNLVVDDQLSFDPDTLPGDLRVFLNEIDDENTPLEFVKTRVPQDEEITLVLNYPHRRSGTLPILPAVRYLLPDNDGDLLALQLIDGQSGDEVLAWYVGRHNYIFGLADWYQKYNLPVGAFITLRKTDAPLKFVIDFTPKRTQQEWAKVVMVRNNQLFFQMKKRAVSCNYDELMILGEEGSEAIDALWIRVERNNTPLFNLLANIFPELMKLSSQSAVHIKTLYSAINVVKRCPPGPLLQELASHSVFVWMGHGYWTYKPSSK